MRLDNSCIRLDILSGIQDVIIMHTVTTFSSTSQSLIQPQGMILMRHIYIVPVEYQEQKEDQLMLRMAFAE